MHQQRVQPRAAAVRFHDSHGGRAPRAPSIVTSSRQHCPRCARAFDASVSACPFDGAKLTARFLDFIPHQKSRQSGAILADRYQLSGELDRGGTARIFLAEDLVRGVPVVVKMLDPDHARDPKKRERFLREAESAKIVDHPNVAEPFFIGTRGDGTPFFVMEFLFGESLGTRLRRASRIDAETALAIARAVATGLAAAHDADVLHRDVKPDNIFLVGEIDRHHDVKILDFGYAKAGDSSITGGGIVLGTADYMAPEQCLSDPLDARVDVYALGAVMYRALTGRSIVDVDAPMETRLAEQVHCRAPSPHTLDSAIPEPVSAVVAKCIKKDPALRYASMRDLLADIERLKAGEPVTARDDDDDPAYTPKSELAREVRDLFARRIGIRAST